MRTLVRLSTRLVPILVLTVPPLSSLAPPVQAARPSVIPAPAHVEWTGGRLALDDGLRPEPSVVPSRRIGRALERFTNRLEAKTGIPALRGEQLESAHPLVVHFDPQSASRPLVPDEAYTLEVDAKGVRLDAEGEIGVLRALETLLQLVHLDQSGWALPAVRIEDRPRFVWRGLLLDPVRHWLPPEDIRRTLDAMAVVKLNVLHWHLTDDQGFRMESLRYPRLHEAASDGRYYTQQTIRQLIAYAADRGIRVVPEIDMPGHVGSWLVGHPELAARPGPHRPLRTYGVQEAVLDPTREEVYDLLGGLLGEVAELFPDPIVHLGGDEVTGKWWRENERIVAFMRERELADTNALQNAFTRRIAGILAASGKRLMGWSEILQADLPHDPIIQVWRDTASLREGVVHGYDAVFSWGYYLDLMFPASFYYRIDPLDYSGGLDEQQRRRILGGEACLWSELVTPEILDAHLWPSTAAIAERLWSPAEALSAETLYERLAELEHDLRLVGVDPRSRLVAMRRRLVLEGDPQGLEIFAETLQPPRYYLRHGLRQADQLTPLNRFTDSLPPESAAARAFATAVDEVLLHHGREAHRTARASLERWLANHSALETVLRRSPELHDLKPLAESVHRVVRIGLEALEALGAKQRLDASWYGEAKAVLDEVPQPDLAVMEATLAGSQAGDELWTRIGQQIRERRGRPVADVAIAPAVLRLVEAAAGPR